MAGKEEVSGMEDEPFLCAQKLMATFVVLQSNSTMIFSSGKRTDWQIKQYPESNYDFLNKSAWPLAVMARDFINRWMFEIGDDAELSAMLKSGRDSQHNAGLLELIFFALCKSSGISIQKQLVTPGLKLPDFQLFSREGVKCFVECSLAANSMESIDEKRKKDAVMEIVEGMNDFPFFIGISFSELSDRTLSKKKFVRFLHELANQYLHLETNAAVTGNIYESDGWMLDVTLIKKEDVSSRIRAHCSQPAVVVDNYTPVFTALNNKKSSKYDIENTPYIICVAIDDLTFGDEECCKVLFGSLNDDHVTLDSRQRNFFWAEGIPVNTSVSAVIFCRHFSPFGLHCSTASIWHNPFAEFPIPQGVFPFEEYIFVPSRNRLMRHKIKACDDLLKVLGIARDQYMEGFEMKNRMAPAASDRQIEKS